MNVTRYTATGTKGSLTLSEELFGGAVNQVLLSQAVRVYQSNSRQGTSKVKTRGEINRTKKKWFKQKGTGNARHGARTPNIFVGGGISHGPNGEQNWTLALPTSMKRAALRSALVAQVAHLSVHEGLAKLDGKTKSGVTVLGQCVNLEKRVLVIMGQSQPEVIRSLRNLPTVKVMTADRVTALEVAMADQIVVDGAALEILEKRLTKKKSEVAVAEKVETKVKPAAKAKSAAKVKPATKAKVAAKKVAKPKAKKA